MVDEEIVQFVWTYKIFGLLFDVAFLVGGCQLGRYRCAHDVEQCLFYLLVGFAGCNVAHHMLHQGLWHRCVDAVHTHLVAVVCCPTERQLRKVAGSNYNAAFLVGDVHEDLCAFPGLCVLVCHIVVVDVVVNVLEMLYAGILDGYFPYLCSQCLHQCDGVLVCAATGTESRHCYAGDAFAWHADYVACSCYDKQGEGRVQSTRHAYHATFGMCVREAFCQCRSLNVESLVAVLLDCVVLWNEWLRAEFACQVATAVFCLLNVYFLDCCGVGEAAVAFALCPNLLNIDFGHHVMRCLYEVSAFGEHLAAFGNGAISGVGC